MEKSLTITAPYLLIPICPDAPEHLVEIYLEEAGAQTKLFEFMIPTGGDDGDKEGEYACGYLAHFPVKQFTDKTLILKGEFSEAFGRAVTNALLPATEPLRRPSHHFTAESGWINDPNGLIFADGVFHLYFQYNPFNTTWNNMSWGHAVSRDLLHWEQEDSVLFPDEHGMMFSGCGMVNERRLLGLPEEALVFFYSAAGGSTPWSQGKEFTQRIAYSLDGGKTLKKLEDFYMDTVCRENRDPKIFWHEESQAYIMVLWLEENDFGIFRSRDLQSWEQSDRISLAEAWECPDLLKLSASDGGEQWMFWSADGFYFWGEFDGYSFVTDQVRHKAYFNRLPYAAQTWSGVDGRVISIPWLRIPNDGRNYTGAMGLPQELSVVREGEKKVLIQTPVRELLEKRREIFSGTQVQEPPDEHGNVQPEQSGVSYVPQPGKTLLLELRRSKEDTAVLHMNIKDTPLSYNPLTGELSVDTEVCQIGTNKNAFSFLIDDNILEVWVRLCYDEKESNRFGGSLTGAYALRETKGAIEIKTAAAFHLYEIEES